MRNYENENRFLTGTLLGGILGSAAGLLMAPKTGKELRDDILDGYSRLTDLTDHLRHPFSHEEHSRSQINSLLAGGATGVILGALAALLLAPQSGRKLREALGERSEEILKNIQNSGLHAIENAEDLKDSIASALDRIMHQKRGRSRTGDIMDWADLGIRLYQQLQKRR
jgi:gas vesicle protein